MADVRRARESMHGRGQEFTERARASAELARQALEPNEGFASGMEALACDLLRQSVHWALRALAYGRSGESGRVTSAELWESAGEALIVRASGDSETLAALKKAVDAESFVEFAEMQPEERSRLLVLLRRCADVLLAELDRPARALEMVWLGRAWRIGLVLLVLGALVAAPAWAARSREERNDMASGKHWRISSRLGNQGCEPPQQSCSTSAGFFFHTHQEKEPWVEFDLGQPLRFSAVRLVNRKDCCGDRAVPLLVEVSTDQKQWREVARRTEEFSSWRADFEPVEARWLRLRVAKPTMFHLAQVRILP